MEKIYVTLGQQHTCSINGKTFDKDSLMVVNCVDFDSGRADVVKWTDNWFHECWSQEEFDQKKDVMQYFPRGMIIANPTPEDHKAVLAQKYFEEEVVESIFDCEEGCIEGKEDLSIDPEWNSNGEGSYECCSCDDGPCTQ